MLELLLPQILAAVVVAVIALRAIRRNEVRLNALAERRRVEREASLAAAVAESRARTDRIIARGEAELARMAAARVPSTVVVTLDLDADDEVADLTGVTRDAGRLIAALSDYEESLGGRGLTLTEARSRPGSVVLTLTPRDPSGSADRVRLVADRVNAAPPPAGDPAPDLGPLPPGVASAHAALLAA